MADPSAHVRSALAELERLGPLVGSSLYATEPLGDPAQPWYVNAVAEIRTGLGPRALLGRLQELERAAGRSRAARWGPRILDLDLLVYGDQVLSEPGLELPHPRFRERRFVLEPLAEIRPGLRDPVTGKSVAGLLADLDDRLQVEKLLASGPEEHSPGHGESRRRPRRREHPEVQR